MLDTRELDQIEIANTDEKLDQDTESRPVEDVIALSRILFNIIYNSDSDSTEKTEAVAFRAQLFFDTF